MEKGVDESVKEYAHRWREKASQISPPLSDKEMLFLFLNTFKAPYYQYLISNPSTNFADMVIVAERVEHGIRSGKIEAPDGSQKKRKKKDTDVNEFDFETDYPPRNQWDNRNQYNNRNNQKNQSYLIGNMQTQPTTVASLYSTYGFVPQPVPSTPFNPAFPGQLPQPYQTPNLFSNQNPPQIFSNSRNHTYQTQPQNQKSKNFRNRKWRANREPLPPLPPLSELYKHLLNLRQIAPVPVDPPTPPYPAWYNPNEHCEYHAGIPGHDIENCPAFKSKIQLLIKKRWIVLEPNVPNVNNNPLSGHQNVNAADINMLELEYPKEVIDMPSLTVKTLKEVSNINILIKEDDQELKNWVEEEVLAMHKSEQ